MSGCIAVRLDEKGLFNANICVCWAYLQLQVGTDMALISIILGSYIQPLTTFCITL